MKLLIVQKVKDDIIKGYVRLDIKFASNQHGSLENFTLLSKHVVLTSRKFLEQ